MLWEAIFVVLCLGASFIGLSLELLPADFGKKWTAMERTIDDDALICVCRPVFSRRSPARGALRYLKHGRCVVQQLA